MLRTPCFCYQGPGFDPLSGNCDPTSYAAWGKKKKKNESKEQLIRSKEVSGNVAQNNCM